MFGNKIRYLQCAEIALFENDENLDFGETGSLHSDLLVLMDRRKLRLFMTHFWGSLRYDCIVGKSPP